MSRRSFPRSPAAALAALCAALLPGLVGAEALPEDDQRWERAEHLELARAHAATLAELDAGRTDEGDPRARAELAFMASEVAGELARQLRLARTIYDARGAVARVLPPGPEALEQIGAARTHEPWLEACGTDGELVGSTRGYLEYLARMSDGSSAAEAFWRAHVEPSCPRRAEGIFGQQEALARYELFLTHFPYHPLAPRAREARDLLLGELAESLGGPAPDPALALVERERAVLDGQVGTAPQVLWRVEADLDGDGGEDLALSLAPEATAPARWTVALRGREGYAFVGSFALDGNELRLAVPTPGIGWLRARGPCTEATCEPPVTYQISDRGVRPVLELGLPRTADRATLDGRAETQLALPESLLRVESCALAPAPAAVRCAWKTAALPPFRGTPAAPVP
jgi:hypothetical protein